MTEALGVHVDRPRRLSNPEREVNVNPLNLLQTFFFTGCSYGLLSACARGKHGHYKFVPILVLVDVAPNAKTFYIQSETDLVLKVDLTRHDTFSQPQNGGIAYINNSWTICLKYDSLEILTEFSEQ